MPAAILLETLGYHKIFAFLLFLPPALALLFLFQMRSFPHLVRRIRLLTPAYNFLLASAVFTGIILAFMQQNYSLNAMMMSLVGAVIACNEIRRYKRQRVIASYEIPEQSAFIAWAKKKYALDIALLLVLVLLTFYFKG
ncbi:MAG: hypothetical protein K2N70_01585 [Helicobacter sp.]|nr:hypothetical protein [Helicobacter sp.]